EDSELMLMRREDLIDHIEKNPKLALSMLVEFSKRLRKADKQISNLALMSVFGRVADVLLQLVREKGRRKKSVIVIENRPTHQEIADMAGSTRETVTRVLGKLQKNGAIIIDKKQIVITRIKDLKEKEI
ncbi:MAG: Crp/Fnr family transcriptional regulator, partial [bacterium]